MEGIFNGDYVFLVSVYCLANLQEKKNQFQLHNISKWVILKTRVPISTSLPTPQDVLEK